MNRYLKLAAILLLLAAFDVRAQFAVPKSNEVVEGELVFPDGSTTHFFAREGTMVTFRNEDQDYWYGIVWHDIVPVLVEGQKEVQVSFNVFELTPRVGGAPAVREVDSGVTIVGRRLSEVPLPVGKAKALNIQTWTFAKVRLMDPREASPFVLQKLYGASGGGLCSVSCGAATITATAVQASCGTCQGAR